MALASGGVTDTERMLVEFCERSFLKLWSYANPYKDDGHELCDFLAIFDNHVFVFFDRENKLGEDPDKDPQVLWDRWKRNVIDRQVKTSHGAERYIRSGRQIYLDAKSTTPFPFAFDRQNSVLHKIIVAHGAKEACERASSQNVYGSLAITYKEADNDPSHPFFIEIDKRNPVHILDSHNMPIVLGELDTVSDFATYLDEKTRAISTFRYLAYCGEEDLLAHYLLNFQASQGRHLIGTSQGAHSGVMIGEGEWHDFSEGETYKNTKKRNEISYFWDRLIERTCKNMVNGTLGGNSNILEGQSAIYEMVKEPRFVRRGLSEKMLVAIKNFPDTGKFARQVTLLPSVQPNVAYVFLQLHLPPEFRSLDDYREKRQWILEIACGAAKLKFSHLDKVIGIGIEAPKYSRTVSEDFILMDCKAWSDEQRAYYEEQNAVLNFFGTPHLQKFEERVTRFVPPETGQTERRPVKIGPNTRCPCGSGKKYKKCHGAILRQ